MNFAFDNGIGRPQESYGRQPESQAGGDDRDGRDPAEPKGGEPQQALRERSRRFLPRRRL